MSTLKVNLNHPTVQTSSAVKLASWALMFKLLLKDTRVCCITGILIYAHTHTPTHTNATHNPRPIKCSRWSPLRGKTSLTLPPNLHPFISAIPRWCRDSTMRLAHRRWVRNLFNRSIDMTAQSILCAHRGQPSHQTQRVLPPNYLTYSSSLEPLICGALYGFRAET